jgi:hypothetical protein
MTVTVNASVKRGPQSRAYIYVTLGFTLFPMLFPILI